MNFTPTTNHSEAGISLFQKDSNFFTLTLINHNGQNFIQLKLTEPDTEPKILEKESVPNFNGDITFKVKSEYFGYTFYYSLDGVQFKQFTKTKSNHILSKKYTGAYLGIYATSNGVNTKDFADFDWVNYKGFERIQN